MICSVTSLATITFDCVRKEPRKVEPWV